MESNELSAIFENILIGINAQMSAFLNYDVFSHIDGLPTFPLIILWLLFGMVFFTLRLNFVNFRLFAEGIRAVRGKYNNPDDPGEITHAQALSAAVASTVGLGNIAGVAFAVSIGGPGAVIWMMIAGFFGMSMKFAEVTLGQMYRKIDDQGRVQGGAFNYLETGLAELKLATLGRILAVIFAIACIGGVFGAGNMFQANQSVILLSSAFDISEPMKIVLAVVMAAVVGVILLGGIKRIGAVAIKIVPLMAIIYISACVFVIAVNADNLLDAVSYMFEDAFSGVAMGGGVVGALIVGIQRAAFSNESGLGTAPIAHSAAKTKEPVREGCVALLEPFIDTIVICFMTGLVITVTGVYEGAGSDADGVLLTSLAFETVISWFPYVLSVCVVLFAFSTILSMSYYGEMAWSYLFGKKFIWLYQIMYVVVVFAGGVITDAVLVLEFSDLLYLSMAIPNLIGMYLLSGKISEAMKKYQAKLKAGEFN